MKRFAILITALGALHLAAPVQAQGFYLGGGVGSVWSDAGQIYSDTVNEDTVAGGKIFLGHLWTPNWGLEFGFHHLGRYDLELTDGTKVSDMQTRAISVAGVYTTPLGAGFDFHARLGLAFTEAEYTCEALCGPSATPSLANVDTKKRGTSGLIGIGLGARLAQNISMRIDWDHIGSVHHQVDRTEYRDAYDMLSVNLLFGF